MSDQDSSAVDCAPSLSPPETTSPSSVPFTVSLPWWLPPLIYLLLGSVLLWRSLFSGEVFLPATLLGHLAPWKSTHLYPQIPPWNPLRWDGIGQFYPWRKFAAETIRQGILPLWNPYQFSGTPFVANSQSAVFYPGNILFVLIPDTARAFGWSALLHLTMCGWFTYLLLQRLRCSAMASLLGGVVFAFSAWQIAWLQLPTFLATSCWFPLLLSQVIGRRGESHPARLPSTPAHGGNQSAIGNGFNPVRDACGIGAVIGMMVLAGHLQIALYGLLAGSFLAIGLLVLRRAQISRIGVWLGGLVLGLMLAMPQLLPSAELSRISHRVGKPSAEGYRAYTEYGLPPAAIATLLLPDVMGGDSDPSNLYWGYYRKRISGEATIGVLHNPIETAVYVGILPLLLGLFACVRGLNPRSLDRRTVFFALLAALALLLALGTPLNVLLYFGMPGFSQSGSPARCLVLWALAWSGLAALGADRLAKGVVTERDLAVVFGAAIAILGLGLNLVTGALTSPPPGIRDAPLLGEVMGRIGVDWLRLGLFSLAGLALLARPLLQRPSGTVTAPFSPSYVLPLAVVFAALDLLWTGIAANPTATREQVYPETSAITYLREHAGHDRIFPINQRWSFFAPSTLTLPVVLPPNGGTVFGLRDLQGYDSLFWGRYKSYANGFARPNRLGLLDASPPEVGNMVFFQNANAPGVSRTGAAFALTVPFDGPGFPPEAVPPSTPIDTADPGMMIYALPENGGRARLNPGTPGSSLKWLEDGPTRVTLAVVSPIHITLSLLDANMPGWRIRVDGAYVASAPFGGDPVIRAVDVDSGAHTLAFRYEPNAFRAGLYAACVALCIMAILLGWRLSQKFSSSF